jgi:hypothetical protein
MLLISLFAPYGCSSIHERRVESARLIGDIELLKEAIRSGEVRERDLEGLRLKPMEDTIGLEGAQEYQDNKVINEVNRTWGSGLVTAWYLKSGGAFIGVKVETEFRGSLCGIHMGDSVQIAMAKAKELCPTMCTVREGFPRFGPGPSRVCYGWMLAIDSDADDYTGKVRRLVLVNQAYETRQIK